MNLSWRSAPAMRGWVGALALLFAGSSAAPIQAMGGSCTGVPSWDSRFANATNAAVSALAVDGNGNVYAGGRFSAAGTVEANHIAKWDGNSWSALGPGLGNGADDSVRALAVIGNDLYAGGTFTMAGELTVNHIAKWDGDHWSALAGGVAGPVTAMAADANGNLYVAVNFAWAGGIAGAVARWDGSQWFNLAARGGWPMNGGIYAVAIDSSGNVYAGGTFTEVEGSSIQQIARWDGSRWSVLGDGSPYGRSIYALAASGDEVYVGGDYITAKWNGSQWSTLENGVFGGSAYAMVVADDGTVYAGGSLTDNIEPGVHNLAKWDGHTWSALNGGVNGAVFALAVSGSDLYVGGDFSAAGDQASANIARWQPCGTTPTPTPRPTIEPTPTPTTNCSPDAAWDDRFGQFGTNALAVDGAGNLYIAGTDSIKKWDGHVWTDLVAGLNGEVQTLAVAHDGTVYAGGSFTEVGGITVNHLARWDGYSWSGLHLNLDARNLPSALAVDGSGNLYVAIRNVSAGDVSGFVERWNGINWTFFAGYMNAEIRALATDANGNVYAGGAFTAVGDTSLNHIARWDGSQWSAVGAGRDDGVFALVVDGSALYAGGVSGQVTAWDGSHWSALGSGVTGSVYALAVDSGHNVFAGGSFSAAGATTLNNVAKWDGEQWLALGAGTNVVTSLVVDGSGVVYAAGESFIASWDGQAWSALGAGMNLWVTALVAGGSDSIYAAGGFTQAGNVAANGIAKWDGSRWSALGSNIPGMVFALAVDVNGTLYAGGGPPPLSGVTYGYVARWDGSQWSELGAHLNAPVRALTVDGNGNIYAGGNAFMVQWDGSQWSALNAGVTAALKYLSIHALTVDLNGNVYAGGGPGDNWIGPPPFIARWDGQRWSTLGLGIGNAVFALTTDALGNVYAGGDFTRVGATSANNIIKWNGTAWSALRTGVDGAVYALVTDGAGNVYAAGQFTEADGTSVNNVARWDGDVWSALGTGVVGSVFNRAAALAVDGSGNVYVGGSFTIAGGKSSVYIARWQPCGNCVRDPGEQCDDGNRWNGDGCSAACSVEAGWSCRGAPSVCRDPSHCAGDCDGGGAVTIDEILTMINVALGNALVSDCGRADANHDAEITIDEILTAVNSALEGCG